jgi:hypothetical protein
MGLSLAIIAKDEVHHLERIISEYQQYFDEIVIGYDDKSCAVVGEGNPKIKAYQYEWSDKEKELGYIFFDRKRNWLKEQVTGDYYLRLDTDDKIINPEVIRAVYEKAKLHSVQVVHVWYQYDPEFGHNRETLIQKTDSIYWKKRVHENIVPVDGKDYKVVIEKGFSLEHLPRPSHVDVSSNRLRYSIFWSEVISYIRIINYALKNNKVYHWTWVNPSNDFKLNNGNYQKEFYKLLIPFKKYPSITEETNNVINDFHWGELGHKLFVNDVINHINLNKLI